MSKLVWDQAGERKYETGVDRGVLFPIKSGKYQTGVAWNGLTAVNESPSGAEPSAIYADNIKYLNLMSEEEFAATIEAYTYPDEFEACDGSKEIEEGVTIGQQTREHFGFCYRTLIGNDEDGKDHGYKIHIVYDCLASPSEVGNNTVNESPEAASLSWEISTTKVDIPGYKPSATLVIDSTKVAKDKLARIEEKLYGGDSTESTMLLPSEVIALIKG